MGYHFKNGSWREQITLFFFARPFSVWDFSSEIFEVKCLLDFF